MEGIAVHGETTRNGRRPRHLDIFSTHSITTTISAIALTVSWRVNNIESEMLY